MIEIYSRERQEGKTTILITQLKNNPKAVLAVHSVQEKRRLCELYPELKYQIRTYDEMQRANISSWGYTECYLDNLDLFLSKFDIPITKMTLTGGVYR